MVWDMRQRAFLHLFLATGIGCGGASVRGSNGGTDSPEVTVDLSLQRVQVGLRDGGCIDAPDRTAELKRLLAGLDATHVSTVAARYCPFARTVSVGRPFFVAEAPNQAGELGLHVQCSGDGVVNGLSLLEMDPEEANLDRELARQLDNWLYRRDEDQGSWVLENVLVFHATQTGDAMPVRFDRLFEVWDPEDGTERINHVPVLEGAGFVHPVDMIRDCGDANARSLT